MPNQNQEEFEYSRVYRYIKPGGTDPGTWRLAYPSQNFSGGGGTGGGVAYDFDGVKPINVDTTPGVGSNPTIVKTSMDIQQLDDRTT